MEVNALCRPRHNPRTASRLLEDEAVVIDPTTHVVRMLNPVGSRVWELADGHRTVAQIAAVLESEYAVSADEALQSVVAFVEELSQRELLLVQS